MTDALPAAVNERLTVGAVRSTVTAADASVCTFALPAASVAALAASRGMTVPSEQLDAVTV